MTIKVRCHQCGKQSQFSRSDAGLTALCVACGARFTVPADTAQTLPAGAGDDLIDSALLQDLPVSGLLAPMGTLEPEGPAIPVGGAGETTMLGAAVVPPAFPSAGTARPAGASGYGTGSTTPRPLLYACLGSAVTILAVLVTVLLLATRPTWEDQNRTALRDLKGKGDAYYLAKQYREAHDSYRELDKRVAGHVIEDPQLRADLATAKVRRDETFAMLLAQEKETEAAGSNAKTAPPTRPAPPPVLETTALAQTPATTEAAVPATGPAEMVQNWPQYQPKPLTTRPLTTRPSPESLTHVTRLDPPPPPPEAQLLPQPAATRPGLQRAPILVRAHMDADPAARRARRYPGELVTDEEIGQAIQNGVNFLLSEFQNGRLQGANGRMDAYYGGLNALCVYALLQSSYAIKDERLNLKGPLVRQMLAGVKQTPMDGGPVTYARGIRATALAMLNRAEDKSALQQDVAYLLRSHIGGAYTYNNDFTNRGRRQFDGGWDNSNSQYGLLGVWSGAEVGVEVNTPYWQAVEKHWTDCQNNNGSWDYSGYGRGQGQPRLSMTVAGIASLFVTHDYLEAPRFGSAVGREPFSRALKKGLAYLETGDTSVNISGGYALYGLERVGLASGFKFFGDHDWYKELAAAVVRAQNADGSWGGEIETAYHLLFLARGRHPVLMNKLRFDGSWANRPRDVANLARFGAKELERALNWQVVPITREYTDWLDSPILYIASHTAPKFTDTEIDKIRNFALSGGLVFTQADGGKIEANQWADELARKLFPDYEMQDLPLEHDVYTMLYKPSPRPRLRGVSNGSRLLMIHSPTDISQHWQLRMDKTRRGAFELGINLFLYAAGKGDLRNRLASPYIPNMGPAGGGTIKVARVKYAGNWDPEPLAWTRFSRYFQRETDVGVKVTPFTFEQLDPIVTPVAYWTGTAAYTVNEKELSALGKYVEAGGVLFIDTCGGTGEFLDSARVALRRAFPQEVQLGVLSRTHPLLTGGQPGTDDLSNPQVRPLVKSKLGGTAGRLDTIKVGQGRVILSPLDVTTGLLGANTWGVLGYEPEYACQLLKNTLIWSATGMKEE